ncbi:hypothetical protein BDQ17DRAFT_1414303 [Cyathus striatus]|nr:hypothetical protein BDQ17DRAFT_1414303 [Cyathus striatus]
MLDYLKVTYEILGAQGERRWWKKAEDERIFEFIEGKFSLNGKEIVDFRMSLESGAKISPEEMGNQLLGNGSSIKVVMCPDDPGGLSNRIADFSQHTNCRNRRAIRREGLEILHQGALHVRVPGGMDRDLRHGIHLCLFMFEACDRGILGGEFEEAQSY